MYRKALAINESLDRRHAAAIVYRNLATLLHARGDSEEASTLLRQAEKLETRSGPTPDIAITLDGPDQLLVAESGPVQLTQIQQQQQQQ
jgi:Flp pilus assembly protein TadD